MNLSRLKDFRILLNETREVSTELKDQLLDLQSKVNTVDTGLKFGDRKRKLSPNKAGLHKKIDELTHEIKRLQLDEEMYRQWIVCEEKEFTQNSIALQQNKNAAQALN